MAYGVVTKKVAAILASFANDGCDMTAEAIKSGRLSTVVLSAGQDGFCDYTSLRAE
jgi:hypothetical protein